MRRGVGRANVEVTVARNGLRIGTARTRGQPGDGDFSGTGVQGGLLAKHTKHHGARAGVQILSTKGDVTAARAQR